ncbi:conserved hypothetical protein [Ixodes scapularis]|uniref:Uncharacterized protein n=1 Tax=Ixodes scapularis TaxID=6945 RepID=B7P581_IXOSC|nr:conserved hypothetical protein [Ixodes scapularis]|eukprot:XP_002407115.1 conserved hypothetical protein [Ixodes scapularis]
MATVPSSVVTTASIYTTSVPLCQATIENQLCATSTVALPIQVSMPSIVTHTMVQPTSALTGTITVPAVTPTVTPITSTNLGIATACTPVLTTTMVKTAPTSLPERHINTGDGVQVCVSSIHTVANCRLHFDVSIFDARISVGFGGNL